MAGLAISPLSLKRYIASAVDAIIQIARFSDGSRKVVSFQELTGMEGEVITMQEIFAFEQRGVTPDGKVKGVFLPRGIRPKFAAKFEAKGIRLSDGLFDPRNVAEV